MLKKIKSLDTLRIIFSYLYERQKLKAVKYNKKIQKKIGVNLNNYKFWNGRYIRYETKEKGKEYNIHNGKLIYEGGYLKGERNGKGKEYDQYGKLEFEGEYLNGKRWNGKGYNKEGKKEF